MAQYRWTRRDPFRDHANERTVSEGDVVELSAAIADNQPGFELVAETEEAESANENSADQLEQAQEDYVNGDKSVDELEEDVEEALEDAHERADNVADKHWKSAVSEVESGEHDDILDEIAEVDDRTSVYDAVEARRAEISDE